MKKRVLAGLLAGIMILSLAGCGNTSSPADNSSTVSTGNETTIQFWNSFTGTDGDVLREIVDNYNKTNKKDYHL